VDVFPLWTVEYFSVTKRNELSAYMKTWRKLKFILLYERSQSEKATYCMIPTLWHSGKHKITEIAKNSVVSGVEGEGAKIRESTDDLTDNETIFWGNITCHGEWVTLRWILT
jgi:hypothetical protein